VNVVIAPDHRMIQSGPGRFIRHPSYTGGLLMLPGFSLNPGNLASLLVIFVPCPGILLWRIHFEETALAQALGEEYKIHRQRTKRLTPFFY
jgi:protein-S-isoprenylcysteine O-methyltransferase